MESVSPDGHTVHIEEYNGDPEHNPGTYGERDVAVSSVDKFIHFADIPAGGTPASDQLDAPPSLTVGSSGSVYFLHVSIDNCARIYRRRQSDNGFTLMTNVPASCGWSTAGTTDITMVPGTDDQAWFAIIKSEGVADAGCGELYLYRMSSSTATKQDELGSCGWSSNAPPSITTDNTGNIYIAATKNGTLWVLRRAPNGP